MGPQYCKQKYIRVSDPCIYAVKVDPSGQTLITGYTDGVMRVLVLQQLDHTTHDHRKTMSLSPARSGMTISSNLTLAHVCKPHKSQLSCLAVDSEGLLLATGVSYYYYLTINSNIILLKGTDSTVFFLSIKDNYEPVGFIATPSPVTALQWTTVVCNYIPLCL